MLLISMMLYIQSFMYQPHFTVTDKVGEFVEIVNVQYDAQANQTYAAIEVYQSDAVGQNPYIRWMQPRPFVGKPSLQDMLKTIEHDPYVTVVGLQ